MRKTTRSIQYYFVLHVKLLQGLLLNATRV